ncbi:unnamed protein product [Ectocarpus sp. 4 AP-2014]
MGRMGTMSPSRGQAAWTMLPSPSTPSARFARDASAGLKARNWVEEVIGRRLPEGDFAAGFKDGQGLCELVNTFRPASIPKIERSASPFHQMANISSFLKACRMLGVSEHVLFETLDLFNENRLPQVVRCLFSLSELVRTTMPSYHGPYLGAPDKPEVDPAVLHLVDIAKGNVVPAVGVAPAGASVSSSGKKGSRAAAAAAAAAGLEPLSLPKHDGEDGTTSSRCCLSPAAYEAGKLTYGVYEGGGGAPAPAKPPRTPGATRTARLRAARTPGPDDAGVVSGEQAAGGGTTDAQRRQAQEPASAAALGGKRNGGAGAVAREGSERGGGGGGGAVEYAESALSVANTPRRCNPMMMPSPRAEGASTPRGEVGGDGSGGSDGGAVASDYYGFGRSSSSVEDQARRRREATAQNDAEMEVALWIEGVTGETFPGKFWSSLKDGVLLCKVLNSIKPGLVPHVNPSRGTFVELENISSFLSGCRRVGVPEHSLFDTKDLYEKRDMQVVVHCLHVLGAAVQSTVPDFRGPFLGKKSEALSIVNARGLRKRLGKGPGARGGIHTLTAHKGGAGEYVGSGDVPIEQPDPTATMTPAESPSGKRASRRREASDSAGGSGVVAAGTPASPRAIAEGLSGGVLPAVILEEEAPAGMTSAVVRVERQGRRGAKAAEEAGGGGSGRQNLAGLFADAALAADPREGGGRGGAAALRRTASGASGVSGNQQRRSRGAHRQRHHQQRKDEDGEGVVSQVQRFVELHTRQPWRVGGDMHESLRDGWQLALLANALRPGAVRCVHNSIQPVKHIQNIAGFLIACRRMGVARALLFDIEDLYEKRSNTRVARTLLALRALAADPDFALARPSSLMGTSLLVNAAAAAAKTGLASGPPSAASAGGRR